MSTSVPIPTRLPPPNSADNHAFGTSLPVRTSRLHFSPAVKAPITETQPPPRDIAALNLCTSAPSVELVSRSARSWSTQNRLPSRLGWDFSELVVATNEVDKAFASGEAVAKRPPRTGVSGTYFFCKDNDEERKLGVFKPMDEEARSIDMSPSPPPCAPMSPLFDASELLPGPALNSYLSSPLYSPPHSALVAQSTGNFSSDSENDSHPTNLSGFQSGQGAFREVAAYLLDHDRFAKVPQTALVRWLKPYESNHAIPGVDQLSLASPNQSQSSALDFFNPGTSLSPSNSSSASSEVNFQTKMGAFQVYVPNIGDADDFGPGVFDKDQVHRIAALDIRTLNHDRHGGNILVSKSSNPHRRYDLVPIDHGYILPDIIQAVPWPVWMDWPMVRDPLSEDTKKYIQYLDPDTEARKLNEELSEAFRPGALQGLKIATMLLQKGVAAGLTLYDIGLLMYSKRDGLFERTELEKIVAEAEEASITRECHLENEMPTIPMGSPNDILHRRHQSMTALLEHELHDDDFVSKYAGRRIQELVNRIAADALRTRDSFNSKGPSISRARSIPDFGIGAKPVHTILNRVEPNHQGISVPLPTPASSPTFGRHSLFDNSRNEQGSMLPMSSEILNSDRPHIRINLPKELIPEPNGSSFRTAPFTCQTATLIVPNCPKAITSEDPFLTGGTSNRVGVPSSTNILPPLCPNGSRVKFKSSPVSTMEPFKWEQQR